MEKVNGKRKMKMGKEEMEKKVMAWIEEKMEEKRGKEWRKEVRNIELVYVEGELMFCSWEYLKGGKWNYSLSILP